MRLFVVGHPAPQGSKRAFRHKTTKKIVMVESSKRVKPWREAVKAEAELQIEQQGHEQIVGPVRVEIFFVLPRPRSHCRTGRFANLLRANAPAHPTGKPDVDKLLRSTFDALTDAGVWKDDSQVVELVTRKAYSTYAPLFEAWSTVGASIEITEIP